MKTLLIVDMQIGFINEYTSFLIPKINDLIENYQLVIATKFFNPKNSNFQKLLNWHELERNSIDYNLAINNKKLITIEKPSYGPTQELYNLLNQYNIESIDICGVDTDQCVLSCALNLFDNGFKPVILADYCASYKGKDFHEAGLKILQRALGENQIKYSF